MEIVRTLGVVSELSITGIEVPISIPSHRYGDNERSRRRRVVTVYSPVPLAGQGLGERVVESKLYPLSLTLSSMNGGEGTE